MNNYEMRITPNTDENGSIYWTASFPSVEGCIGTGNTAEEAVAEAQENLKVYLEFLLEDGEELPQENVQQYSGRIALRLPKTTHKRVADTAEREGVSINLFLNNAIQNYLGINEYEYRIDDKISKLQKIAEYNLEIQQMSAQINQQLYHEIMHGWTSEKINLNIGDGNE